MLLNLKFVVDRDDMQPILFATISWLKTAPHRVFNMQGDVKTCPT